MAKSFTSSSLTDKELQDLDPWLQENLGDPKGGFWIIERNEKTGKVEAVMMDENFTSKSRRTIPEDAIPAPTEDDSMVADEPVEQASKPANRFSRPQRDFSLPKSVAELRSKSRGEPYTPPPTPSLDRIGQETAQGPEPPAYRPYKYAGATSPERPVRKPRFADPVAEEPEAELPQVVDPVAKKPRRKKTTAAASSAFDEMDSEIAAQGPDFQGTVLSEGKMTAKESADLRKKTSRTAPVVEEEATPAAEPAKKKDRKNIFQRAGGMVAGAARGIKDTFAGSDATFSEKTYVPEWINDPDVGVSEPGSLASTSRTMALDRLRQNKNKKSGTATLGKVEYWTDPNDGTTFVREVDSDEDELPAEVDMTEAKNKTKYVDPSGPKPDWVDNPPAGSYVGRGKSKDLQMGIDKAVMNARQSYAKVVGETEETEEGTVNRATLEGTRRSSLWIDPETGITHILLDTPDTVKKKPKTEVKLEAERFEGESPEGIESEAEQIEIDLEDPEIMDRLTNPRSSLPVDDPEPVGLPLKTKARDEQTDTKIVKDSPVATEVVLRTQKALGTNWKSPKGQIIITDESLEEAASKEPNPPFRLVIDPNDNIANLLDADGMQVESFAVGTGDTTGVRYGKKYFTPTGTSQIINKVPYEQVEGSYGPMWMGLDWDHYGLHGPHKRDDIESSGEGFENEGFVSHGCMRFMEKDLIKLSEYLEVGSSVEVLPYDTRPNVRGPLRVGKQPLSGDFGQTIAKGSLTDAAEKAGLSDKKKKTTGQEIRSPIQDAGAVRPEVEASKEADRLGAEISNLMKLGGAKSMDRLKAIFASLENKQNNPVGPRRRTLETTVGSVGGQRLPQVHVNRLLKKYGAQWKSIQRGDTVRGTHGGSRAKGVRR